MNTMARKTMLVIGIAAAIGLGYGVAYYQQAAFSHSSENILSKQSDTNSGERKILYYRNPMGLPDTSPTPKKDSMGMDYVPVYADDKPDDSGSVIVSPARIQTLGVKTATVKRSVLDTTVRANARIEIDERSLIAIAPRFEGWVEQLHVNAVGDLVKKGQPLFTAYSPELQSTGEELQIAERLAKQVDPNDPVASKSAQELVSALKSRLQNMEVAGQTGPRQTFFAPANGFVIEKPVIQGSRFMPGESLFRFADLSKVWIIADVYEQDLANIKVGQNANVLVDAFPNNVFEAKVSYIYPTLNTETRSTPVRLVFDNAEALLRPGMFARITFDVGMPHESVTVPTSAVIDDGKRQVVLLALEEGRFKPQSVTIGKRGQDLVEVLDGVEPGDRVVISANFLIDSESQLKAALSNFVEPSQETHKHQANALYNVKGVLEKIDAENMSVVISHEVIPELNWPAMTMPFDVSDIAIVKNIPLESSIDFVLEENASGEYVVTSITVTSRVNNVDEQSKHDHGHEGH